MDRNVRNVRDWLFLSAYLSSIFIFLPLTEYITRTILDGWPQFSSVVTFSINLYICVIGLASAAYTIIADKRFKTLRLLALSIIISVGLYGVTKIENPLDKLHIIEYSLLSFLLFRVLRFYNFTSALYLWCIIFVGMAGLADESVQCFIPGRCASVKDWMTDIGTCTSSIILIAFVICPILEKWRIKLNFLVDKQNEKQRWMREYKRKSGKHRTRHKRTW